MTYNALRQAGYWIINGCASVSQQLRKCIICRKLRAPAQVQKMVNLPEERVTPASPFTYSGMDVFGPWYFKEGRKELKCWGLIFTCLSSRAIHLETLNSTETDAFINALRRFINRRGKDRELRCDQGSNFIGAKNELNAALKEVNADSVKNFLLTQDCDLIEFKMNVPCASHMGGIREQLICTVRSVLAGLLDDHAQQLDEETLQTLFTEAENIVNSRPLTVDNLSDPEAPEPITPNHLENTLSLSSATLAQLDFLILIDNFIVVLKLSLKSTAGTPIKYSITDHMERYSPLYGECTLLSKSKMYCFKARKKVSRDYF